MPQKSHIHAVKIFLYLTSFSIDRLFGRYLTKLCDQVVALISADYSASIVWNDADRDGVSVDVDAGVSERLFTFEVAKTNEQEESAVSRHGFQVTTAL